MRVERVVEIAAKPGDVWAILVDWERQSSWMPDADRVSVLSGSREGVGTTVAVRTRVMGIPLFTERLKVVTWEPPKRLCIAHMSFVQGLGQWLLEPSDTGTTFRWIEELSIPIPVLGWAALRAYRPVLHRLMGAGMRRLGRLAEARGRV